MGLLEYLKKILGDEEGQKAYDKIQTDKENVLLVDCKKESKYTEKKELDTANQTIKDYKKQLKDRDTQLEGIKGKVKDNEELTGEIEKLKGDNAKAAKEYEDKLAQMNFDSKFDKELGVLKTRNPKVLKALLDMGKIKMNDDGSFIGLKEQVEALKESDKYLFEVEDDTLGGNGAGGTGSLGGGGNAGGTGGEMSFGERLAKERVEAGKVTEAQNKFFG